MIRKILGYQQIQSICHAAIALITFVLFVSAFGAWFSRTGYFDKKEDLAYSRHISIPSPKEYILNYDGHIYDADWLYQGGDPKSIEQIKSADVLFMGSSYCTFLFQSDVTQRFFKSYGLRYYNLCFNHLGRVPAEEIIKKYDLHPQQIIFFIDHYMIKKSYSEEYYSWNNISQFTALKRAYLAEATVYFQHYLHRFIPYVRQLFQDSKILLSLGGPANNLFAFRSRRDGTHRTYIINTVTVYPVINYIYDKELLTVPYLESLQEFNSYLTKHNIKLILASADTPDGAIDAGTTKWFAEKLDVPFIVPEITDMPTKSDSIDGSHLNDKGAQLVNIAYLEALKPYLQKASPPLDQKEEINADVGANSVQGFKGTEISGDWKPIKIDFIRTSPYFIINTPRLADLSVLTDGNLHSSWVFNTPPDVDKEYLLLNITAPNSITRVRWFHISNLKTLRPWEYEFELYTSKSTWNRVANMHGYTARYGEWVTALIKPQQAETILLYFTFPQNIGSKTRPLEIGEVAVDTFDASLPTPPGSSFFNLSWIVPENASGYDLRWSYQPIVNETDWENSNHISMTLPSPSTPAKKDTVIIELQDLSSNKPIYFALRVQNANGNLSDLSNVIQIPAP